MSLLALNGKFDPDLVDALEKRLASGTSPEIDPTQFAASLGNRWLVEQIIGLLDAAAKAGLIEAIDGLMCPVQGCGHFLSADDLSGNRCPHCGTDFRESGDTPKPRTAYRIRGGISRDIPWLIAIHGFNTLGTWQEEFSWRISNKLKYSAPVLIYKYGLIRFSVLVRWRHRVLARQLGNRIRSAMTYARERGIAEPPDIVIHSFGSQLFVILLDMKEFADLKFGRVIATGSVVRPDFAWSRFITNDRIEAVLNHCGGKDSAVPFAQFFIPGTGPGGKRGFSDVNAVSVLNADYGHSSCFEHAALSTNLDDGGLWDRFLRQPTKSFVGDGVISPQAVTWRPAPAIIGFIVRMLAIGLLTVVGAGTLLMFAVGLHEVARNF